MEVKKPKPIKIKTNKCVLVLEPEVYLQYKKQYEENAALQQKYNGADFVSFYIKSYEDSKYQGRLYNPFHIHKKKKSSAVTTNPNPNYKGRNYDPEFHKKKHQKESQENNESQENDESKENSTNENPNPSRNPNYKGKAYKHNYKPEAIRTNPNPNYLGKNYDPDFHKKKHKNPNPNYKGKNYDPNFHKKRRFRFNPWKKKWTWLGIRRVDKFKKHTKAFRIRIDKVCHIYKSNNNVFVTLAKVGGGVIFQLSSGKIGKKGPQKDTPNAAHQVGKAFGRAFTRKGYYYCMLKIHGLYDNFIKSALRGILKYKLRFLHVEHQFPVSHNGIRLPKARRK